MSNFKRMVRERMAKTGESWSTASRHVRKKAELRKAAKGEEPVVPAPLGPLVISEPIRQGLHDVAVEALRATECCGGCGKEIGLGEKHDSLACWNKRPCPSCGEVHGFDWDSDPLHKICKGCGYKWDKV
jgi:hypothetical protein